MRKITLLLAGAVAIAVVAMIAIMLPERGAGPAEANDPDVEFFMEIKAVNQTNSAAACSTKGKLAKEKGDLVCSIPLKGTLNLSVELNDAGVSTGSVGGWQAVIGWTPGLTGPGDPGSTKALSVKNCSFGATAAPFGAPQTAAGGCSAFPAFNGIEEFDIRLNAELTCGNSPSQELVTLIVNPAAKSSGTAIFDQFGPTISELQNKVITVLCLPQDGQININVVDAVMQTKKLADTCWLISVNHLAGAGSPAGAPVLTNKPFAVVSDNNAKPACGGPIKGILADKDPAVGRIAVTIPAKSMLEFDSDEWHFQQVQAPDFYNVDPTKYVCTLSGLFKKFDNPNLTACDEADTYVIKNVAKPPPKQPKPGDTDGDGCPDVHENGLDETLGGQRDYLNPNDFYDVAGSPLPPQNGAPDGVIDLPNDILGVIQHHPAGTLGYDVQFDRGPWTGPNSWNDTQGPDGVIDLPNDILGVILQFNHRCLLADL